MQPKHHAKITATLFGNNKNSAASMPHGFFLFLYSKNASVTY